MIDTKFRAWSNSEQKYLDELDYYIDFDGAVNEKLYYGIGEEEDTVLEQYLGIKDRKGVEICEGDLIEARTAIYRVEWFNTAFWVSPVLGYGNSQPISNLYEYRDDNIFTLKVVGNIHENADLLK